MSEKKSESDNTASITGRSQPSSETERLVEILHGALDRVGTHAGRAERGVRERADEVREGARTTGRRVRARSDDAANAVEEYVDDHPWAAVGIAFGAGIILSSILRR